MKRIRSHPGRRWLAAIMSFMLTAPYLLVGGPARAQRTSPDVYVLDFNNRTSVGGQLLGRVAAAQVSLQLSDSNNWNVVPDAQVQKRIQDLGLRPPFDRVNRVQIANGVDATAVVYGDIIDARVSTNPQTQAYVKLQVLVEDVKTGTLVNGAIADAYSTPRMGFTGEADVLLEEALGKAAYKAREQMDTFRLPEGTVLNTTVVGGAENQDTDALINIGTRQGVRRGMDMIVTRQREVVGRVRVTSVDADISTARVTENGQGIRPEDRVRAVFNFSDFSTTSSSRVRRRASGLPAGAVRLASAEGIAPPKDTDDAKIARVAKADEFIKLRSTDQPAGTQLAQNTVQAPPPVVVDEPQVSRETGERHHAGGKRLVSPTAFRMLVGGLLVMGILALGGRGGNNASRATEVRANEFQLRVGAPGAAIKVCWDRPKAVHSNAVLQYVIYRYDVFGGSQVVGALNDDTAHCFIDTTSTRATVIAYTPTLGSNTPTQTTFNNVPGITLGTQYRYQISTVYDAGLQNGAGTGGTGTGGGTGGTGGGGTGQITPVISPQSLSSDWVTAIAPPIILSPTPGQQVNLAALDVTWQKSAGADSYVIWMSNDQGFRNHVQFGPFQAQPPEVDGFTTASVTALDARSSKLNTGPNKPIYISVGAYNSQDPVKPQPFGAIFSPPVGVIAETPPPPVPGSSAPHQGKGNGNNGGGNGNGHKGHKGSK